MDEIVKYLKIEEQCSMISHLLGGVTVSHCHINPEVHVFYLPKEKIEISVEAIGKTGHWEVEKSEKPIYGSVDLKIEKNEMDRIIKSYNESEKERKDELERMMESCKESKMNKSIPVFDKSRKRFEKECYEILLGKVNVKF